LSPKEGYQLLDSINLCEHEKLHLSGEIQPHGVLFCVNAQGLITACSANSAAVLGLPPQELLGQSALTLFDESAPYFKHGNKRVLMERSVHFARELDVLINKYEDGGCAIEIYPHAAINCDVFLTQQAWTTPHQEEELLQSLQTLLEDVAKLTGFQRIMYYQFVENNDGEVAAEHRHPSVQGSYLGLRFPASDIPQIARDLYLKNPWRLIPDAAADSVAIISAEQTPPDLSYCDLRSVSPMHKIYLANMGVRASLSFPVVVNNMLVALIACHDHQPNIVSQATLEACRSRVNRYGLMLSGFTAYQRMCLIDGLNHRFNEIQLIVQRNGGLINSWNELAPWLLTELNINGVVLTQHNLILKHGCALEDHTLAVVEQDFINSGELIWSKDCLSRQLSSFVLSEVAGVMAVKISNDRYNATRLYLCQTAQVQEIAWGGNPEKPVEFHDGQLGIAPRQSFAKWVEKRIGYSLPWNNKTRLLSLKLRELLSEMADV